MLVVGFSVLVMDRLFTRFWLITENPMAELFCDLARGEIYINGIRTLNTLKSLRRGLNSARLSN